MLSTYDKLFVYPPSRMAEDLFPQKILKDFPAASLFLQSIFTWRTIPTILHATFRSLGICLCFCYCSIPDECAFFPRRQEVLPLLAQHQVPTRGQVVYGLLAGTKVIKNEITLGTEKVAFGADTTVRAQELSVWGIGKIFR